MFRRRTLLAVAAASVLASPADAEPRCEVSTHVWDLQLVRVEALSGTPDLHAVARALGTQAVLRGGYRDPARWSKITRIELRGSSDGVGLTALLESLP